MVKLLLVWVEVQQVGGEPGAAGSWSAAGPPFAQPGPSSALPPRAEQSAAGEGCKLAGASGGSEQWQLGWQQHLDRPQRPAL